MTYQYSLIASKDTIGKSFYNYFRHGNDGLAWDCLQIIGLARGAISLEECSPVWSCVINGRRVPLAAMDAAYIGYVQSWFKNPHQDMGLLQAIHEKTDAYEKEMSFE